MKTAHKASSTLFLAFLFLVPAALYADHSININTADKAALMTLNGIGEVKAQAVIDYRTTNGPFAKIEDIQNVSGIGPATYANIKDHIVVSSSSQQQSQSPATSTGQVSPSSSPAGGGGYPSTEPDLIANAGKDRTVIVGADAIFEGKAYTKDGEPLGPTGIRFLWNFGDGKTAEGYSVLHRFAHDGRYVVTLTVSSGRDSASHRIIVTAKPAAFSLSYMEDGSAVIENKTNFDLDLSWWHVRSGGNLFSIPEDTILLTKERIIIPPASLGFSVSAGWSLLYPNGEVVATAPPPKPLIIHEKAPASTKTKPNAPYMKHLVPEEEGEKTDALPDRQAGTSTQIAAVSATIPDESSGSKKQNWLNVWTIGFTALTLFGATSAYITARIRRKEWDIEEV